MRKLLTFSIYLLLAMGVVSPMLAGWDEGVAAFSAKNYQKAAAEFEELVRQNPDGYRGHYMLGLSLTQLGRKEEALQHLRKAYDLNPNDLSTKIELGRAYFNVRRYGDVTKLLGPVDPSSLPAAQQAAFYQMRGQARFKAGDESAAVADLEKLARLQPNSADIQYTYGTTALSAGDVDKGVAALAKAVQLDPKAADKKRAYAQALIKKGRMTNDKNAKRSTYLKAATAAKELTAASPTYENYMLKISAELGAGQFTEAIESGKMAVAKKGDDWLAYYYLGQAYGSAGKYAEAERPLLQAKERAKRPEDMKLVWRQLGYSYEKQKEYTKAVEAYQFAGDQSAITRVRENEQTQRYNQQVEEENAQIREMEAEAKRLEEELKALEEGGGN